MRADRPSLTGTLVAGVRALYSSFPSKLRIAPDPHATALVPAVLALPSHAVAAAPWLAPLLHHSVGVASIGMSWHVALRTLAIDDAARESLAAGARQVVLLGAGLDNRADRLPEIRGARVFEVDHPDMQRYKRERLSAAGVPEGERVFVPVDFEHERVEEKLKQAGFAPETPTFWIWEGVTPYLTHAAIEGTLAAVSQLSAEGSRLAITYMRPASDIGHGIDRLASFLGGLVGEHLRGQYARHDMESLLGRFGFSVLSDESDSDLADRYWKDPGTAHPRTIRAFPEWERLAIAERVGR